MKKRNLLTLAAISVMFAGSALAKASVEIEWQNPEEYRDVKPVNQSRSSFREQTFKRLEEYINELAEKLPDGQVLTMTVTDLDLAGEVWPASFVGFGSGGNDVRLVKPIYIPRMAFSYTLKDKTGALLKSDEVKIKDMSFQDRHNSFFTSEALRYEKEMLKDWFLDAFPEMIARSK